MATKDIGGGNNDFGTPALWASYLDGLNTLTEEEIGVVFKGVTPYTGSFRFTGFTATASAFAHLTVASGHSFADASDGTPLAYDSTNYAAIEVTGGATAVVVNVDHTVIERIQIKHIQSGIYNRHAIEFVAGVELAVLKDFIATCDDNNSVVNAREATIANGLIVASGSGNNNRAASFVDGGTCINVTAVNTGGGTKIGINTTYGGDLLKNTVVTNFSTCYNGAWGSADYNGASDSTTPGTNVTHNLSLTDTFVSHTTDFRLKSGSGAINKANRDAGYTLDIRGTLRDSGANSSDLGCIEFISAGGGGTIHADAACFAGDASVTVDAGPIVKANAAVAAGASSVIAVGGGATLNANVSAQAQDATVAASGAVLIRTAGSPASGASTVSAAGSARVTALAAVASQVATVNATGRVLVRANAAAASGPASTFAFGRVDPGASPAKLKRWWLGLKLRFGE